MGKMKIFWQGVSELPLKLAIQSKTQSGKYMYIYDWHHYMRYVLFHGGEFQCFKN